MKGLHMGTTKIHPTKTAGQIQELLAQHNATSIQMRYDKSEIVALDFAIMAHDKELLFTLPVRWEGVLKIIMRNKYFKPTEQEIARAKRIAWRQIYRWVQAQLALVEVEMVEMEEVFLPYLITSGGSLYKQLSEKGFKQIGHEG